MTDFLMQIIYWLVISVVSFGIVSYLVFTSPEYEEQEDGSLTPKE